MKHVRLEQFEEELRAALVKEIESIEPSPKIKERIMARLFAHEKVSTGMFGIKLIDRLFPGRCVWKKALVGALAGCLFVGGLTLGLSPEARAWAKEKVLTPVVNVYYRVVRTDNGYSLVQVQRDVSLINVKSVTTKKSPEFSTAAEAEKYVGFPVRLPSHLPAGYKLASLSGDKWGTTGKGFLNAQYQAAGEGKQKISLMITDERALLKGGDAVKEVKVGDNKAYWAEFPIVSIGGEEKESTVVTGHMLKWEASGVVYVLKDFGQLSFEEMQKIAGSIK